METIGQGRSTVTRYQKRISGPLMDRIVIHMQVPRVDYQKLRDMPWCQAGFLPILG